MIAESIENIKRPWSLDNKAVLLQLHADFATGFSSDEAARRLQMAGLNKIESAKKTSLVKILITQFVSPFVLLLGIASGLSFYLEEWPDGIAIVAVIVINAIIGFIMEFQAERSMEGLKKLTNISKVLQV